MLDALNRAKRYRELAKGCRRLAAIGFSTDSITFRFHTVIRAVSA